MIDDQLAYDQLTPRLKRLVSESPLTMPGFCTYALEKLSLARTAEQIKRVEDQLAEAYEREQRKDAPTWTPLPEIAQKHRRI